MCNVEIMQSLETFDKLFFFCSTVVWSSKDELMHVTAHDIQTLLFESALSTRVMFKFHWLTVQILLIVDTLLTIRILFFYTVCWCLHEYPYATTRRPATDVHIGNATSQVFCVSQLFCGKTLVVNSWYTLALYFFLVISCISVFGELM